MAARTTRQPLDIPVDHAHPRCWSNAVMGLGRQSAAAHAIDHTVVDDPYFPPAFSYLSASRGPSPTHSDSACNGPRSQRRAGQPGIPAPVWPDQQPVHAEKPMAYETPSAWETPRVRADTGGTAFA